MVLITAGGRNGMTGVFGWSLSCILALFAPEHWALPLQPKGEQGGWRQDFAALRHWCGYWPLVWPLCWPLCWPQIPGNNRRAGRTRTLPPQVGSWHDTPSVAEQVQKVMCSEGSNFRPYRGLQGRIGVEFGRAGFGRLGFGGLGFGGLGQA